jgi:cytochrome P450
VTDGLVEPRPVEFDPLEDGFAISPFEQYRRLRTHDPVHRSALLHGWVLTRYDDVVTLLRDPKISVELANATSNPVVENERLRQDEVHRRPTTLVLRDDPDHARLRRLMQAPFGPRAIDGLRAMIVERVGRSIDDLGSRDQVDVITDFAYPLPVGVFCEMFGVPEEDSPRFRAWTASVARNLDPVMSDEERRACMHDHDDMYTYLESLVEEKRRHPGDDILTSLVHAEADGDRMSADELIPQVVTLYVAGHEPTTALIGGGLLALLRNPAQMAMLRGDHELIGNAVAEFLRYDGPNQFVRRIATEPISMGGRTIDTGDVIYAGIGAANRDPARWGDDADEVHIDRVDASHHLQFGSGVHNCLGTHLARLQAEVALVALLDRYPSIELTGEPTWSPRMVIRGLQSLPVSVAS